MGQVIISGGAGGGVTSDEVTVTANRVVKGYTYVGSDTDDEIGTGTLELSGTAVASNVESGATFYNTDPLTKVTGSLPNISTGASITYTSDNSTPVVAGDNAFMAENSDGTSRLCVRYTGEKAVIQNNTLLGYPSSNFGDATAAYVYTGKTFTSASGIKLTGTMTVSSIPTFSAAVYSTTQITLTWTNPAQASGRPFSGVHIRYSTSSAPTSTSSGTAIYTGTGSSETMGGSSSVIVTMPSTGTKYYFSIWAYATTSLGKIYSPSYKTASATTTASGRKAFTSSTTYTIPSGVRSINIHLTGGGGAGRASYGSDYWAGGGGGGGYTTYKTGIAVVPGNIVTITVGAGGTETSTSTTSNKKTGGDTTVTINNTAATSLTAEGGYTAGYMHAIYGGDGGSGGGHGSDFTYGAFECGTAGAKNGASASGTGQGTTTYEFGNSSATLYSGGGGGGGGTRYHSGSSTTYTYTGQAGGDGGGGKGADNGGTAVAGSAGTGGGGGGGYYNGSTNRVGASGGSGCVVISW